MEEECARVGLHDEMKECRRNLSGTSKHLYNFERNEIRGAGQPSSRGAQSGRRIRLAKPLRYMMRSAGFRAANLKG